MKRTNKALSAVWLCLLILSIIPIQAFAIEPIEPNCKVSLTIHYQQNGKVLSGARFDVYRVADVSEDATFTASGAFADYPKEINGLQGADKWDKLAQELLSYAKKTKPTVSGTIGGNGTCAFQDLPTGLYLVVGHDWQVGNVTYRCKPFAISLPQRNADTAAWDYNVDAAPKAGTPTQKPTPPPDLPQTGMLWWPVPVMLCAGVALLAVGVVCRRRGKQ